MTETPQIREKALSALTTLALNDEQFRGEAIYDLEGTLVSYGFSLNEQEMQLVTDFHSRVANMNDEDLLEELNSLPGSPGGPRGLHG